MFWPLERSQVLVLAACIVVVAFATILTKLVVRVVLGKDWAAARVKVPWRFSLLAIAVLTALVACVLGLLRDSPDVAILVAGVVLFLWFPIARFMEFQQIVAERRKQALAASVDARRGERRAGSVLASASEPRPSGSGQLADARGSDSSESGSYRRGDK